MKNYEEIIKDLEAKLAAANDCADRYWKQLGIVEDENEKLKQQLVEKDNALKLAREYMFNVMCADDVPSIEWFIKCAKEMMKSE